MKTEKLNPNFQSHTSTYVIPEEAYLHDAEKARALTVLAREIKEFIRELGLEEDEVLLSGYSATASLEPRRTEAHIQIEQALTGDDESWDDASDEDFEAHLATLSLLKTVVEADEVYFASTSTLQEFGDSDEYSYEDKNPLEYAWDIAEPVIGIYDRKKLEQMDLTHEGYEWVLHSGGTVAADSAKIADFHIQT